MPKKYLIIFFFLFISCLNYADNLRSSMDKSQIDITYRWVYGRNQSILLVDNLLYAGNGGVLQILDISTPHTPELVNEITTDGLITEIKIYDEKAFVLIDDERIQIIDVSDSSNLTLLGTFESQNLESNFYNFVIKDECLLIASGENGILLVNIEDILNPILIDTYNTNGIAYDIISEGDYLFVANGLNLLILNVLDLTNITEVSTWNTTGIDVEKNFYYDNDRIYFQFSGILFTISVAIPETPYRLSASSASNVLGVNDNKIFLYGNDGITIVDVTNHHDHEVLVNFETGDNNSHEVIVSDNLLIVADSHSGLYFADISNSEEPTEIAFYPINSYANNIERDENLVYLTLGSNGLIIFDISNPENPVVVNSIKNDEWSFLYSVEVTENYIFLCASVDGVRILDKTSLEEIGYYKTEIEEYHYQPKIYNVLISEDENLMYVPSMYKGLQIVNIENPNEPYLYSSFELPENSSIFDVVIRDNIAYTSNFHGKYNILDISTLDNMSLLSTIETSENGGNTVALKYPYLYTADGDEGMQVINVLDPYNPTLESTYDCNDSFGWDVVISESYLLFLDVLHIYDVSNSSEPELLDYIDLPGSGESAIEVDGYIYLANGDGGLYVIAYDPTEIDQNNIMNPNSIELSNYPNPFRPTNSDRNSGTTIAFSLSNSSKVEVVVYNIKGQRIKTLADKKFDKGRHTINWNGLNNHNQSVSSGVYFYKVVIDGKSEYSKRCLLLK